MVEGSGIILQEMKNDVSTLSTVVISQSSSIKSLEQKMGQLTSLVYGNPYKNSMFHANENQRDPTEVSTIVTRRGKTFQERIKPDNVNSRGGIT